MPLIFQEKSLVIDSVPCIQMGESFERMILVQEIPVLSKIKLLSFACKL